MRNSSFRPGAEWAVCDIIATLHSYGFLEGQMYLIYGNNIFFDKFWGETGFLGVFLGGTAVKNAKIVV